MKPKTEKLGKEEHAESPKTITGFIEIPIFGVIEDPRRFRGTYLPHVVREKTYSDLRCVKSKDKDALSELARTFREEVYGNG